jgi:tRNA pseudouridine38-40 synthase
MNNFALLLAYDGAKFRGWQKQPGMVTVQGELEKRLRHAVNGAARTDAGVHALGQVANFRASHASLDELSLPEGLRLLEWRNVDDSFHARASAVGKRYRYELGHFVQKGDWERARAAMRGLDDLPSLSGLSSPSTDRRPAPPLTRWELGDDGSLFIEGTAFRKHQVRNIAGHLGAVALGYAAPETLRSLAQLSRPWRGARAPAEGLTLLEVLYPSGASPFAAPAAGPPASTRPR